MKNDAISRRSVMKGVGALGAMTMTGIDDCFTDAGLDIRKDYRQQIFKRVAQTPFIDTHEHLIEEKGRFIGTKEKWVRADDWSLVLRQYFSADFYTSGAFSSDYSHFYSPSVDPLQKWKYLEPYWPFVKNTGYGMSVQITLKELYDVDELSAKTIPKVQSGYEEIRRPGFYKHILQDLANIKSCQVNNLEGVPFMESDQPLLLMQDISIVGMFAGPDFEQFGTPSGIAVSTLSDWHKVIDWWFEKYGRYATGVKSQNAYSRDIDYKMVPAENVEKIFVNKLSGIDPNPDDQKMLEDHLFWYAVQKATEYDLPIKMHTGFYSRHDIMPLSRVMNNPGSATELCRMAPHTRFVFMHIGYPYYEEMISIAKHYSNAYLDMCWAWIINPVAAKDFLKKYLVTAPANKILTFGGDYFTAEPVVGHAAIARRGISLALSELVEESWLTLNDAIDLIEHIMYRNAERIFNLNEKERVLKQAPWR